MPKRRNRNDRAPQTVRTVLATRNRNFLPSNSRKASSAWFADELWTRD
jgi:hypothetical protein